MEALLGDSVEVVVTSDDTLEREFVGRLEDASGLAFRVALGVLHNREDAEDIAQEALVRAYRNFDRLRDRERFRAWLVRIAWRLALDHRRSQGRRERRELAVSGDAAPPGVEQMAAWREFERHLCRIVFNAQHVDRHNFSVTGAAAWRCPTRSPRRSSPPRRIAPGPTVW
jgi:DNA-directed RNA polymerase specialized sigma24 family protein